jgi:hypothetical protein
MAFIIFLYYHKNLKTLLRSFTAKRFKNMRILTCLALFTLVFTGFSVPAKAAFWDNLICWFTPCTGSGSENFTRPYLEDGKKPHNVQHADDDWVPADWVDEQHSKQQVMSGLYSAGIITDQSRNVLNNQPEIEVGQGFMRLSGQEKRRVIQFVDYVSGFTKADPAATILIHHKASGDQVGYYNAEGLILQ